MVKEKLMEKNDWQQRTELLLGEEKMNRIRKAHVLVVGLGGVGAYAAEMLCRTGVGKMTIVDADTVQPTNMNRQLPAMHSTLGMPMEKKMFRTPDTYGYFTLSYNPFVPMTIALSGTYTGSMMVEHKAGFIDKDIAVNTPDFFELNLKAGYDFNLYKGITMQVNAGVHNIFNAYQSDFDRGAKRDSGYIYGPGMPRSYFAGVKLSF